MSSGLTSGFSFSPQMRSGNISSQKGWDISEAYTTRSAGDDEGEIYAGEDIYRIYGDSRLFVRIVDSCGLRKDLVSIFGKDIADEMLTISSFLLETDKNLSRLEAEARVQWFPSSNGLSPERITKLSQSITKD